MLRTRTHRREEPLTPADWEPAVGADPEGEAELADSVGLAMLVVLETLGPAERLAFVLHDMFGVSFDEIGPIVGRSPAAARQLASRARRRVRGTTVSPSPQLREHQRVVEAFLAASRNGDLDQLLELLDPNVVLRTDRVLIPPRAPSEIHGSAEVAQQFDGLAQLAREALVNGAVGIVVAPKGRLKLVITVAIVGGKITEIEVIADPDRLPDLELAALN